MLKKNQDKLHNAKKRGSWGDIKPVTKVIPNKKAYNRKKEVKNYV